MLPEFHGVSVYFSFWLIAAVGAGWIAAVDARDDGMPGGRVVAALAAVVLTIIVGSKLYFLAGYFLFPSADAAFRNQEEVGAVLRQGYRIPGGILLLAAALPLIGSVFRLPTWRFADALTPALGIAVIFVRLGCFMNGCCYGYVTHGPLGVQFPAASKAYETQMLMNEIAWPATHTLPVHPLQLYYALAGAALFLLARRWQLAKQLDGEVFAKGYAFFFVTTFLLEFFRAHTVYINLIAPPLAAMVAVTMLARARQKRLVAVRSTS
jgi:phosphatidylglycerol:prolipoprotein diacylglycerol transferase